MAVARFGHGSRVRARLPGYASLFPNQRAILIPTLSPFNLYEPGKAYVSSFAAWGKEQKIVDGIPAIYGTNNLNNIWYTGSACNSDQGFILWGWIWWDGTETCTPICLGQDGIGDGGGWYGSLYLDAATGKMVGAAINGTPAYYHSDDPLPFPKRQWVHVALHAMRGYKVILYVNGVPKPAGDLPQYWTWRASTRGIILNAGASIANPSTWGRGCYTSMVGIRVEPQGIDGDDVLETFHLTRQFYEQATPLLFWDSDVAAGGAGNSVSPGCGVASFVGLSPSVSTTSGLQIPVPVGVVSAAGFAPAIFVNKITQPEIGSATISGLTPSILTPKLVQPTIGVATLSGQAPSVILGNSKIAQPGQVSVAVSGQIPTVSQTTSSIRLPANAVVAISSSAPNVIVGLASIKNPSNAVVAVTGLAPLVAITDHQVVKPITGSIGASGQVPTDVLNLIRVTPVGIAAITGQSPTVGRHQIVQPGVGTIAAGSSAVQTAQTNHIVTRPDVGQIGIEGQTTGTLASVIVRPGVGAIVCSGQAPSANKTQSSAPGYAQVAVTGLSAQIFVTGHHVISIPVQSVGIAGQLPGATGVVTSFPLNASLSISGFAPELIYSAYAVIKIPFENRSYQVNPEYRAYFIHDDGAQ